MLRSEVAWFRRVLLICEARLSWMNPEEMDYVPMQQITQSESQRHVRSTVKAYNQPHFEDLIHLQEELAKKAIARENGKQCTRQLDG